MEYIVSDMYEPYLLVQKAMFPKAKYVVDRFHYTRYIMDALDKVRIRYQKNLSFFRSLITNIFMIRYNLYELVLIGIKYEKSSKSNRVYSIK